MSKTEEILEDLDKKLKLYIGKNKQTDVALIIALEALEYYAKGAPFIGFDRGDKAREALTRIRELVGESEDGE